jgi:thiol:disulfide interchange protein
MNTPQRPTVKLWIAFASLCSVAILHTARDLVGHEQNVSMQMLGLAFLSFGAWLLWHFVLHVSGVQVLRGICCLLLGVLALIGSAAWLLGSGSSAGPYPLGLRLIALLLTAAGWLLAIDKDVARYRAALENEKRQKNANG